MKENRREAIKTQEQDVSRVYHKGVHQLYISRTLYEVQGRAWIEQSQLQRTRSTLPQVPQCQAASQTPCPSRASARPVIARQIDRSSSRLASERGSEGARQQFYTTLSTGGGLQASHRPDNTSHCPTDTRRKHWHLSQN